MNYLPINQDILNTHKVDCWAYYCYLYKTIKTTYCNFTDTITINITLDATRSIYGRAYADLSQPMWSKYKKNWETDSILILNTHTTMMPLEVFEKLHNLIMTLPSRSRSTYCYFYMYMYFKCHSFKNDYGTTMERLEEEIRSNSRDASKKFKFFDEADMLHRMGRANAELGVSFRYFIPLELCCPF